MAYQALYRQWRPQTFSEMVGQEHIVQALRNQVISGRIAHAYLFCGSRGTGKTSTAKILARAINCQEPNDGDPCGHCACCTYLQGDSNMDVLEYDAASNSKVDQARELLESVMYPPSVGRYKVYIIDEVHMLSDSAFNALLKTLEEPPQHAVFILATTEPQKVPATILSRCQRFDFGRIPTGQIADRLAQVVAESKGVTAEPSALRTIARAAEGGMRDALSMLDMCMGYGEAINDELVRKALGTSDRTFLFQFSDALQRQDASAVLRLVDQLMRAGHDPQVFAREMADHIRSLLVAKTCPEQAPELLEISDDNARQYVEQSVLFSEQRLLRAQELFMAVEGEIRYSSSPRSALETASLNVCLRTAETDTSELQGRIAELEQRLMTLQAQLADGSLAVAASTPAQKAPKAGAEGKKPAPAAKGSTGEGKRPSDLAWRDAMSLLMRRDISIHSFLATGRFIGSEGELFRWEGEQSYVNMLMQPRRRQIVEEALTQACGESCRFEAHTPDTAPTKPSSPVSEQQHLDSLAEAFGAQNVIVQD